MNNLVRIFKYAALAIASAVVWGGFVASCTDQDADIPDNFYSSTKLTAAGFIENNTSSLSSFQQILERANYMSMLKTYGEFTVFAPTNEALETYLTEKGYKTLDEVPEDVCDTIARQHIVKTTALFTTDSKPTPQNMNDRYIQINSVTDTLNDNAVLYLVNNASSIIQKDDSVTNGVVHIVDKVITASNEYLPDLMAKDPTISLFVEALKLTGMADSLTKYIDESYTIGEDTLRKGVTVKSGTESDGSSKTATAHYNEKRYFKFTAFVEPNSVFEAQGITNIEQLKAYAKQVYDLSYPEDAGKYDEDFTDRRNPLNRFVSYHLIDRQGVYEDWVPPLQFIADCQFYEIADAEDYFETMLPHSIMRFSYAYITSGSDIYINRNGCRSTVYDPKAISRGVRVFRPGEGVQNEKLVDCRNGIYHYIDRILTYDANTRDIILNRRLRIDASTTSPDFMNGTNEVGGRNKHTQDGGGNGYLIGYKRGFLKNWKMNNETSFVGLIDGAAWYMQYEKNCINIVGSFDVEVKLPPVPRSGEYEIRIGTSAGDDRGVVQAYINNEACGIPVDMRIGKWASDITGFEPDDPENPEYNIQIDKAMHNLGYMKDTDIWGTHGGDSFRADGANRIRRILWRGRLEDNKDYWLRLRQVLKDPSLYVTFDYIELCPKSVFQGDEPEDQH